MKIEVTKTVSQNTTFFVFESGVKDLVQHCDVLQEYFSLRDFLGKKDALKDFLWKRKRILLVGLGKEREFNIHFFRDKVAEISRWWRRSSADFEIYLDNLNVSQDLGQAVAEGIHLGLYTYSFKTEDKERQKHITTVRLITKKNVAQGITKGTILSESINLTRYLVNSYSRFMTPERFAQEVLTVARACKLSCKVFTKKDIQKLGMNALLAVSEGSNKEPRFISLEYKGGGKETIVLIGKGITFDSGGIGIKTAVSMADMKTDKAGASVVLGIMKTLALLKPKLHVVGLMALTENMPGEGAYKPGDVLTTYNGKTVEIIHTDAEGRLVLADALGYSRNYRPDLVIDLATLTGACIIALGKYHAGLFGNDKQLLDDLFVFGQQTNEKVWPLPLTDEYDEMIKSDVADVANLGGWDSYGGAITAAAFLKKFVPEKAIWAHLDIAGTAVSKEEKGVLVKGATGFGVKLVSEYLLHRAR